MDNDTYLVESQKTMANKPLDLETVPLTVLEQCLHSCINVGTQADAVKKGLFYGKPLRHTLSYARTGDSSLHVGNVDKDLIHAAFGIFTEATEMLEALLKAMQSEDGKVDKVNFVEELGDVEWYMAQVYRALNTTPERVKQKNIDKLRQRYGDSFNNDKAIKRDLPKERKILEER